MIPRDIPPPPASLNLGDLAALVVGSEFVCVCIASGALEIGERVHTVTKAEGERLRTSMGGAFTLSSLSKNPGTRGMYGPVYYVSANPEHIAQSKTNALAKAQDEAARQAVFAVLLEQARPIGELLGDGEQYGSDGEPYQSSTAARELAERLTSSQLDTLAGWLGLPVRS